MAGKAGLKAGLIGLAVMLVLTVINRLLPISGVWVYVSCGVSSLMYVGIGVLAGFFLAGPRTAGKGAGAGAIAGLISAVVGGIVGGVILVLQMKSGGPVSGLDPQQMQQLAELGIDPVVFTIPGIACSTGLGIGLAAIGGAIFAAIKPD
jgi:hypothetical protein